MRFIHNTNKIEYVVRPSQHQFSQMGTRMANSQSITAKFRNNVFDSVTAEKSERWDKMSPKEDPHQIRLSVEEYLLSHGDMNGGGLYVEGTQPGNLLTSPDVKNAELGCAATITAPDGSLVLCAKRPVVREDMCAEHAAAFLGNGDPEPEPSPSSDYVCDVCGKPAKSLLGLNSHKRSHAGEQVAV